MCGIAGFELGRDDDLRAAHLLRRLARRGPDGAWSTVVPPYGLVQTRLSVIDLSDRVRYPLVSESGDLHLLFNGEVYEHGRHRAELQRRGHHFATECDSEVVLHGYEEWGMDLFRRLDGMFAVALLHAPSGELVLVRDALGIKPLVYTTGDRFAFSSDAISLVAAGLSDGTIEEPSLNEYLAFHYLTPPATALRDIKQLQPGEALRRTRDGATSLERWRPRLFGSDKSAPPATVQEAADMLDRSVGRQLVADVPVGVFLSSGLDSSLVLHSAVRSGARPTAVTIAFPGHGDYDESPAAARFADDLGVPHVIGELSGGFVDAVTKVSGAFDVPLADASAIATVRLAELARDHITVALSGTGGDDLFAGYYRHRAHVFGGLVRSLPAPARRLLAAVAPRRGGERRTALSAARGYAARLAQLHGDGFDQYLELIASASSSQAVAACGAFAPSGHGCERLQSRVQASDPAASTLRRIQALELASYLPGDLLVKEDRATMAVGLETRVPLLGIELVEFAEQIPDRQKIGLTRGKKLLREVARRRLPGYLLRAHKRGFAVPLADLFGGPWRSEAIEWFDAAGSSIVDTHLVARLLRDRSMPATDVWALAALVGWESVVVEARHVTRSRPSQRVQPG